jgi:hypothetical protein
MRRQRLEDEWLEDDKMVGVACKGKVVGRTVLLEEGAELPEGATVEVRLVLDGEAKTSRQRKQEALARLLSMNLPVADWEQMENEIIAGALEE